MSKKASLRWLKGHRDYYYQQALGKLLKGEVSPEYVARRWDKVKETRGIK